MRDRVLSGGGAASEAERELLSELDFEALRSERLRAIIIAVMTGIGALVFAAMQLLLDDRVELLRQYRGVGLRVAFAQAMMCLYEVLLAVMLSHRLARRRPGAALAWRYANALIELILPTSMVWVFVNANQSAAGLLMPPALLYYLFIFLGALRMDFGVCVVTGVASAIAYLGLYLYALQLPGSAALPILLSTPFHHGLKAVSYAVCGVVAGIVTVQLRQRVTRAVRLVAERNRVTTMFGLYVSPSVVDRLMQRQADVEGELREVCVLFLDIRAFTQFSEKRPPDEVVRFLNSLFAFMIDIVSQHNGIINKFLGDGFMAIFGAPLADGRECQHAIRAALDMVATLEREIAAGHLPETRIGIGLHYGPALTGSIGSPRRKEYTIIGDTVNLASRIEQLTKQHGAQILASASVLQAAGNMGVAAEPIGQVAVRGREAPLELFKLA